MQSPSLRLIEIFRTLMKFRSLTKAAETMHLSQPAISQALRDLESQLGLTLFVRGGRDMRPTAAAVALLPEAERLLAQAGALRSRALELKEKRAGELSIAVIPALAAGPFSKAMTTLMDKRPKARIRVIVQPTADTVDLVKHEQVDIALTTAPVSEVGIESHALLDAHLCCVVRRNSQLGKLKSISLADLEDHRVATLSGDTPPGRALRAALKNAQLPPGFLIETNNAASAIAMVEAGLCAAVVDPLALLSCPQGHITARSFQPAVRLQFALLKSRHRDTTNIAKQFVDLYRRELNEATETLRHQGLSVTVL